ncbi:hypothetical protein AUF62_00600 [archaeon 13_1_20CM_52_20]|nr:MAG: hypothetical protein AUF62_00600 [archaeon 13_1_20CM_52_20]
MFSAKNSRLNVTIWLSLRLRATYPERVRSVFEIKDERAMGRLSPDSPHDTKGDLLLAIGVGFLINLIIGVALPEIGPFVAGLVAGVIIKQGPWKGALAGFFAGTLGGLASIGLWVATNLLSLPGGLWSVAFQTAVGILTATYAILSLSGGIIGSVVAVQHWPRLSLFLKQHRISFSLPFHLHQSTAVVAKKREE